MCGQGVDVLCAVGAILFWGPKTFSPGWRGHFTSPLAKYKVLLTAFKHRGFDADTVFRWRFNIFTLLEYLFFFSRKTKAGKQMLCHQWEMGTDNNIPSGYEFVTGKYNWLIQCPPLANSKQGHPIRWLINLWDCSYSHDPWFTHQGHVLSSALWFAANQLASPSAAVICLKAYFFLNRAEFRIK